MIFIDRYGEAAGAVCDALSGVDYAARLESEIGNMTGRNAVAVSSVDAALHTALHLCGVADDYVFVPTFTYYSYIATVVHAGGIPVFLDCDRLTRCVSPAALETAFIWAELQNKPPKAVIVDNAFGAVADYDVLVPLCKAYGVPLIELATQGMVGEYNGKPCGANGDLGVVGFDKRLAGGGAVLLCGDEEAAAREFARQAYTPNENHDYRLHNCIAALDCAQLATAKKLTVRARKNLAALCEALDGVAPAAVGDAAVFAFVKAFGLMQELRAAGYDVKKLPPVHTMPQYAGLPFFEHEQGYPVCRDFDEYCLIGMDISLPKRWRLIAKLKSAGL